MPSKCMALQVFDFPPYFRKGTDEQKKETKKNVTSDEGARAHAVLMSIKETCALRKENFFDYAMGYLAQQTSEQ